MPTWRHVRCIFPTMFLNSCDENVQKWSLRDINIWLMYGFLFSGKRNFSLKTSCVQTTPFTLQFLAFSKYIYRLKTSEILVFKYITTPNFGNTWLPTWSMTNIFRITARLYLYAEHKHLTCTLDRSAYR